jgi:hypothetical protein
MRPRVTTADHRQVQRLVPEPGSFRDPASSVCYLDGRVLRRFDRDGWADFETLAATRLYRQALERGELVATTPVALDSLPAARLAGWAGAVEHERIPVVSYPYEWTFSMLKAAALCQLDLLLGGLAEGLTMKDGHAANVQFRGAQPVFIDVGSFTSVRQGEPWAGYRQFCETALYPLLLTAHRGVRFQPWLRGAVAGIDPQDARRLLAGTAVWRAGVMKHVVLHQAMAARMSAWRASDTREELKAAGFSAELQTATVKAIRKLVTGLRWRAAGKGSAWSDYQQTSTYSAAERDRKAAFVERALASAGPLRLCVDLGANDGAYARIAARHADYVVAVDHDEVTADRLWQQLAREGDTHILPLCLDLADPPPGLGWRGRERLAFDERVRPDAVLALALIHHLTITGNLPMAGLLDWWRGFGGRLVVEFVDPADPMAERLLANKPAGMHGDYRREVFERLLAERFDVVDREELTSGSRVLYHAVPRA